MIYIVDVTYFDLEGDMVDSGFKTDDRYLVHKAFEEYMTKVTESRQNSANGFHVTVEEE